MSMPKATTFTPYQTSAITTAFPLAPGP